MRHQHFLTLFLCAIFLFACKSTQRLTEEGNYDEAIEKAINRLAGKKKKKSDVVESLELAFAKANSQDMNEINRLRTEKRPENWERIFDLAVAVDSRQGKVEPLLPLMDVRGRKADFKFIKINGILQEAKGKAAQHLYESAQILLSKARSGDKSAARQAYDKLERIERYLSLYKDRTSLMQEARNIGVSHILFRMENDGYAIMSRDFEREMLSLNVQDLNELWREFYTRPNSNIDFDYEIVMKLNDIDVSPESLREREFREEKEIQDGEKTLRDTNGNVVKDSTGTVVKVPNITVIAANIVEVYQSKSAIVGGTLYFYDNRKKTLIDTQPITTEAIFENYASTFQGDRRALSSDTKRRIGNRPQPFPSDEALLLDAADALKPIIKDKIAGTRFF